jgi:hypothetical protein
MCGNHSRSCSIESVECYDNGDCCDDEHCDTDTFIPGLCIPDTVAG